MPKPVRRARRRVESVIPKEVLLKKVAPVLEERGMTQTEAAYAIWGTPSEISLMVNGRTRGISPGRLIRTLTCLGRDVDIVLRASKRRERRVRVVTSAR
jgi:predicted XRE-type DNA-binding protein